MIIVYGILSLVIFGLALYLGYLLVKIKNQKSQLEQQKQWEADAREKQKQKIDESLEVLTKVVIQHQCELTEGCIRIKKIMDEVAGYREHPELQVFHQMYEEIKDFAILDDYKKLTSKEKFQEDNKRYLIEERYQADIIKACHSLREILPK